jgi:hypothetical protein
MEKCPSVDAVRPTVRVAVAAITRAMNVLATVRRTATAAS